VKTSACSVLLFLPLALFAGAQDLPPEVVYLKADCQPRKTTCKVSWTAPPARPVDFGKLIALPKIHLSIQTVNRTYSEKGEGAILVHRQSTATWPEVLKIIGEELAPYLVVSGQTLSIVGNSGPSQPTEPRKPA
jgi:hypothetical protein